MIKLSDLEFRRLLNLHRIVFNIILVILLLILSFFGPAKPVYALEDCTEAKLRDLGVAVVSCTGGNVCQAPTATTAISPIASGSAVYVLGDSLTVGMRDSGDLEEKMTAKGWVVKKTNAIGGKTIQWGSEQISADASTVADSDVVIVGLGTNHIGDVIADNATEVNTNGLERMTSLVTELVENIKTQNANAKIYWTNVYITGLLETEFGSFDMDLARPVINQAIEDVSRANNVTIIPWATSTEAPNLLSSDGIHPSNYPGMADYVVGQLSGSASVVPTSVAGCECSASNPLSTNASKEERYQQTWNYLVTNKGLKPEAAAGLMGNLEAESGINPHNTQNDAVDPSGNPVPDGPEIPIDLIRGSYGYGIAQWTSAGRQQKLVDIATRTNRSSGDLGLQLDFLWEELNSSYTSVLAVLQAGNVTLEAASDEVLLHFEIPASVLPPPQGTEQSKQNTITARRKLGATIFNTYSGLPAGSFLSSTCAGSGGAVIIDLETKDTTSVACAPGTTDSGVADAYNAGQPYSIRICDIDGVKVNSQLSGPYKSMMEKAAADNVQLVGQQPGFRTMDEQIAVYNTWCATAGQDPSTAPFPKAKYSDNVLCIGGAPPGYSNHQMGLAIDFQCGDSEIPMGYESAKSNPCFIWLSQNAQNYGLFEYGKGIDRTDASYEGWHWSIDGN